MYGSAVLLVLVGGCDDGTATRMEPAPPMTSTTSSPAPAGDASPPGSQLVVEHASGIQFSVLDSAVVMRPTTGDTIGAAAPEGIAKLRASGVNPALLQAVEGARVATVGSEGTVVTLSELFAVSGLPSDSVLNEGARTLGGVNPRITHRKTEFGDTAVQRYLLPTSTMPQGMLTIQTLFIVDGQLWSLAAAGAERQTEAAYELATATLTSAL
jgi:hypothetical protein